MKNLIELPYLNEACYLSENIDPKKFQMVLNLAQESLRDVLGPEFYEQIETQYDPAGGTFSTDNATLYENYIKDFLAWTTFHNHLGFSQSDSTPTGFRQFKDENSDILADVKLFSLEKNVLKWANHYKYSMITFLELEQTKDPLKYPLFLGHCKTEFSWGVTSIAGNGCSDRVFSLNQAVRDNE